MCVQPMVHTLCLQHSALHSNMLLTKLRVGCVLSRAKLPGCKNSVCSMVRLEAAD